MIRGLLLLTLCCLFVCCDSSSPLELESPDGRLKISLLSQSQSFQYLVSKETTTLLDTSYIDLGQGTMELGKPIYRKADTLWSPVWGQFSEIRDQYNEIGIPITSETFTGHLWIRAYNQGMAFRYEGNSENELQFSTSYNFDNQWQLYAPNGEREPHGPLSISEMQATIGGKHKSIKVPLVAQHADRGAMAFLESDLYSATTTNGLSIMPDANAPFVGTNSIVPDSNVVVTPWRVILVADDLAEMPTNTLLLNVAAPSGMDNTDWVKPGLTLWDWRVHGYTTVDGFEYGINTASYKRFIDFAAANTVPYFMIDDAWFTRATSGHFEVNPNLDMPEVLQYAEDKGVDIILYYDRHKGDYGDEKLFTYYADSLGVKGIKYGFMGTDVDFTKSAIKSGAENGLLIDFHDGPLPISGVERTLPNAITREYCHAQQDSRRAFTPESFIKMALINAITGPLDMNNGNFDLKGINSGSRKKGPKKKDSYRSTVASEAARSLIIHSGLVCIPDAPEAYAAKADLFDFIKNLPVGQWDESTILSAQIGSHITTARRHGTDWYVGTVAATKGLDFKLELDFLTEGVGYEATVYADTPETDTNPEAYAITKHRVTKGDTIRAHISSDGGNCIRLKRINP